MFASSGPLWIFDREGRIVYASAECGRWLGVDPDQLVGRSGGPAAGAASGAAALAEDASSWLDRVAASLSPPAGAVRGEIVVQTVRPAAASAAIASPAPRPVVYVPLLSAWLTAEPTLSVAPTANAGTYDRVSAVVAIADLQLPVAASAETAAMRQLIDAVHRHLAAAPDHGAAIITLGSSVAAARLKRQIGAASTSFFPVTLVGPLGNPVEWIVRHIHAQTPLPAAEPDDAEGPAETEGIPYGRGPVIAVDGPLMDAELFDATTGGVADRLLQDSQATAALLVHGIDQMPQDAQQRLELLVHNHPRRLRVFATTPRPTAQLEASLLPSIAALMGTFEIAVPGLADRIADIPLLAAALLERRRAAGETRAEQLGRDALDRLVLYPWPGNFLELDEAIRTAARNCRGETIRVEHLPLAIRSYGSVETTRPSADKAAQRIAPLDQALERYERELIARALERTDGNRAAAARLLQISRPRLLRRIDQLGVEEPES